MITRNNRSFIDSKIYKVINSKKVNMLPGDPNGLPIAQQKAFKVHNVTNYIQVPGMALLSNAGLPILSNFSVEILRRLL